MKAFTSEIKQKLIMFCPTDSYLRNSNWKLTFYFKTEFGKLIFLETDVTTPIFVEIIHCFYKGVNMLWCEL